MAPLCILLTSLMMMITVDGAVPLVVTVRNLNTEEAIPNALAVRKGAQTFDGIGFSNSTGDLRVSLDGAVPNVVTIMAAGFLDETLEIPSVDITKAATKNATIFEFVYMTPSSGSLRASISWEDPTADLDIIALLSEPFQRVGCFQAGYRAPSCTAAGGSVVYSGDQRTGPATEVITTNNLPPGVYYFFVTTSHTAALRKLTLTLEDDVGVIRELHAPVAIPSSNAFGVAFFSLQVDARRCVQVNVIEKVVADLVVSARIDPYFSFPLAGCSTVDTCPLPTLSLPTAPPPPGQNTSPQCLCENFGAASVQHGVSRADVGGYASALCTRLQQVEQAVGVAGARTLLDPEPNVALVHSLLVNGSLAVQKLARDIDSAFSRKRAALMGLKAVLETALLSDDQGSTSYEECCLKTSGLRFEARFNTAVDLTQTCVRFAANGIAEQPHISSLLSAEFQRNLQQDDDILWQYYGSRTGMHRIYPAVRVADCATYDSRERPWYPVASGPQQKHIVLVIDRSLSMSRNNYEFLTESIKTAQALLASPHFSSRDKVNAIMFGGPSPSLYKSRCFNADLPMASAEVISNLGAFIQSADRCVEMGGTQVLPALESAFDMLAASRKPNSPSEDIILLLSDGIFDETSQQIEEELHRLIGQYGNVTVFPVSRTLTPKMSLLSNATKGKFFVFSDQSLVRYPEFFVDRERISTSTPYLDFDVKERLVTLSAPVYDGNDIFQGVVGVDVILQGLLRDIREFGTGQKSYAFLVNRDGVVFSHPSLPGDENFGNEAVALDISELEISSLFASSVRQAMIESTDFGSARDGSQGVEYHWAPAGGSRFVVGIVLFDQDRKLNEIKPVHWPSQDCYHRRADLGFANSSNPLGFQCKIGGVSPALTNCSAFKFSPSSFETPLDYVLQPESFYRVNQIEHAVRNSSLFSYANPVRKEEDINDARVLSQLNQYWIGENLLEAAPYFRYVGTSRGVFRVYPGIALNKHYDPRTRDWFAAVHDHSGSETQIFSSPYVDAFSGNVLTTISWRLEVDSVLWAVMGVDIPLTDVNRFVHGATLYKCRTLRGARCALFTEKLDLVWHSHANIDARQFTSLSRSPYFIGLHEPAFFQRLTETQPQVVIRSECNNPVRNRLVKSYRMLPGALGGEGLTGQLSGSSTATFHLVTIPKSNLYFVFFQGAVERQPGCRCDLETECASTTCSQCEGIAAIPSCPCSCSVQADPCTGANPKLGTLPPCKVDPQVRLPADPAPPQSLNRVLCLQPERICEQLTQRPLECSLAPGCQFCYNATVRRGNLTEYRDICWTSCTGPIGEVSSGASLMSNIVVMMLSAALLLLA